MSSVGPRWPAEWEPQAGVWLTWPHERGDWADDLDTVVPVFVEIGAAIACREPLLCLCPSSAHADAARQSLLAAGAPARNLLFTTADTDDTWARDYAPLTTVGGRRPRLNGFVFNGWGGKFKAGRDATVGRRLAAQGIFGDADWQARDLVLEGGALETDGAGTLLATRSSVLSHSRNPSRDSADVEDRLRAWLGIDRFLWLDHGALQGDDTDGHVDTLARFADPKTILYTTAPPGDPDHSDLERMAGELASLRQRNGQPYRLLPLPFPGIHRSRDGRRLPATYANFLIINGAVLLPVYASPADRAAIATVAAAFPGREIVAIDCRPLIEQNGSLHCLTMQFPDGVALGAPAGFVAA